MEALTFLFQVLIDIILSIFLLRVILQMVRGNFRNPIAQMVSKVTDPVIMPLRKVLPPIGKIDTASVISCLFIALIAKIFLSLLGNYSIEMILDNPLALFLSSLLYILYNLIQLYVLLVFLVVIISWIQPQQHSPLTSLLHELTQPLLAPVRSFIKPVGSLDLSPAIVLLLLFAAKIQLTSWMQ